MGLEKAEPPDATSLLRGENVNPTTIVDCAGSALTQEVLDFLLARLRNGQGRFNPPIVDIRLRNVNISELPTLTSELSK